VLAICPPCSPSRGVIKPWRTAVQHSENQQQKPNCKSPGEHKISGMLLGEILICAPVVTAYSIDQQ
jgi:hypothetical protein